MSEWKEYEFSELIESMQLSSTTPMLLLKYRENEELKLKLLNAIQRGTDDGR